MAETRRMIRLTIIGTPAPQGSKTKTRWGMREDNPHTKPWRATVAAEAAAQWEGRPLIDCAVELDALFVFPRPKSHYRTGRYAGQLRTNAPRWCEVKPDADKLARAIGDALTGVLLRDDKQIVQWTIRKVYGDPARCELELAAADEFELTA
jgi:crossover junction endodeoxyribonuclease RusA